MCIRGKGGTQMKVALKILGIMIAVAVLLAIVVALVAAGGRFVPDRNGTPVRVGNEVRHAVELRYGIVDVLGDNSVVVEYGIGSDRRRETWRTEQFVLWDNRRMYGE